MGESNQESGKDSPSAPAASGGSTAAGLDDRSPSPYHDLLVDESPDALFALSLTGRVLSWNRGAQEMFGYAPAEVIGRTLEELIIPEDQEAEAHAALVRAVSGGIVFEAVRRRKNGARLNVAVSMRLVHAPGVDPFVAV